MLSFSAAMGGRFSSNPAFLERIELGWMNLPSIFVFSIFLVWILLRGRKLPSKSSELILTAAIMLLPSISRWWGAYPYGSIFALLSWIFDLAVLWYVHDLIGRKLLKCSTTIESVTVSVALLVSMAVFLSIFGFQKLIGFPRPVFSAVLISIGIFLGLLGPQRYFLSLQRREVPTSSRLTMGIFMLVLALPVLPYLFTPSPPDSDIAAMKEIIGFIFQGQSLGHVLPGVPGEFFSIRYPWGVPGLAWIWGHLLMAGASESLTLLWLASWILLVANIAELVSILGGVVWVALLFTLNRTFLGPYGFGGGQVQEMLAYAFGVSMVTRIVKGQRFFAGVLLSGSMVSHPVVALPFCLVWAVDSIVAKKELVSSGGFRLSKEALGGSIFVILAIIYLGSLSIGGSKFPSQPEQMLKVLTPRIFYRDMIRWLDSDTFGLGFLCVFLFIPTLFSKLSVRRRLTYPLVVWFIGANIINGLFGNTTQFHHTATFHAGFSVCAVWIVAAALISRVFEDFGLKSLNSYSQAVLFILWALFILPSTEWKPASVFATHSDIRASKFIASNTSDSALIAVVSPYSEIWGNRRSNYTMIRGDSYRNNLFSFISSHQVKDAHFVAKPVLDDILKANTTFSEFTESLRYSGATHLLILSRPESSKWVGVSAKGAIFIYGNSYVFKI